MLRASAYGYNACASFYSCALLSVRLSLPLSPISMPCINSLYSWLSPADHVQDRQPCIYCRVWFADVVLSLSGVTYVFCFVFVFSLFSFDAAALCSIVLGYVCAPAATRSYLTTNCLCPFVLFCFVSWEVSLFTSIFVPLPFPFC